MQASLWKRLLAWQLDWVLIVSCVKLFSWFFPTILARDPPVPNIGFFIDYLLGVYILTLSPTNIVMILPIAGFLLYRVAMESSKSQGTVGHLFFNLKVADKDGNRINISQSVLRNFMLTFSSVIWFLDCVPSLKNPSQRLWHDRITRTRIIAEPLSEVRFCRSLWLLYILAFGYVAVYAKQIKSYVTWLAGQTEYMTPLQVEEYNRWIISADLLMMALFYAGSAIAVIGFLLWLKASLGYWKNTINKWMLKQKEAYLALVLFLIPPLAYLLVGGISTYILWLQSQMLLSGLQKLN